MDRVRSVCRVRPATAAEKSRGPDIVRVNGKQHIDLVDAAEYVAALIFIPAVSRPIRLVLGPVEFSRSPLDARRGSIVETCWIDAH